MDDYDSPWKEILEVYFEWFLAFLFPEIHAAVDWGRGHEFLDKEFQKIVREAEEKRRTVDKLVKVWLKDGKEAWLLIHVEVQCQNDAEFLRRMFTYHYRLLDRYNHTLVSLAVLGDEDTNWRPNQFGYDHWGCSVTFRFPTVKLLDYAAREAELQANPNPFAAIVLAHLKTLETREDAAARRGWKIQLVKSLYERGLDAGEVRKLFRFIDWVMYLPKDLDRSFWEEIQRIEEEKKMPYVDIATRMGIEEGMRKALLPGIELSLELKFGDAGLQLMDEIRNIERVQTLEAIHQAIRGAATPDDLRRLWS